MSFKWVKSELKKKMSFKNCFSKWMFFGVEESSFQWKLIPTLYREDKASLSEREGLQGPRGGLGELLWDPTCHDPGKWRSCLYTADISSGLVGETWHPQIKARARMPAGDRPFDPDELLTGTCLLLWPVNGWKPTRQLVPQVQPSAEDRCAWFHRRNSVSSF